MYHMYIWLYTKLKSIYPYHWAEYEKGDDKGYII